jgi:hypothetical protein
MKRIWTVLPLLTLGFGGCAIVSGTPSGATSAVARSGYDVMDSTPPVPLREEIPHVAASESWVPGYYEPVAGTWIWHQGEVIAHKDGYRLVPAGYHEESGKVYFTPPRWRRADLSPTELSSNK